MESNPKFYIGTEGHAYPIWPKTTPEKEIEEPSTLKEAVILIGAAGSVVIAFFVLCWLFAIAEVLL